MKYEASAALVVALTVLGVTLATRTSAPPVPDAHFRPPLFIRIPPADPAKYEHILNGRDWRNPYLGVGAIGVGLRTANPRVVQTLSIDGVTDALERLPDSAWPYGIVVAISMSGPRTPGTEDRIAANREELVKRLERLHVAVDWWP